MADPNFSSVVLLAGNENANNGSTFIDQSNSAHTLTPFLSRAVWDNANNPTGLSWSVKGTAGDSHVTVSASADFDLGNVWTIEMVLRIADAAAGAYGVFSIGSWSGTSRCVLFEINSGKPTVWMSNDGSVAITGLSAKQLTSITTDTNWHNYTFSSDGSNVYLFYDGTLTDTVVTSSTLHSGAGTNTVSLAQGAGDEDFANSRWASTRITKGVCRYTANFTPPTLPMDSTGAALPTPTPTPTSTEVKGSGAGAMLHHGAARRREKERLNEQELAQVVGALGPTLDLMVRGGKIDKGDIPL